MDARMGTEEALVGLPSKGVNQVYTKKADQCPNVSPLGPQLLTTLLLSPRFSFIYDLVTSQPS